MSGFSRLYKAQKIGFVMHRLISVVIKLFFMLNSNDHEICFGRPSILWPNCGYSTGHCHEFVGILPDIDLVVEPRNPEREVGGLNLLPP